jgi:hypothetical protein
MSTKVFNFQAALRSKKAKLPVKAIEFTQDDHSDCFYPEMGEQRNPTKPILGQYLHSACLIQWKELDDTIVRELLKKYRIRPKYEGIEYIPYGAPGRYWNNPPFGKCGYYEALITMKAYGKLHNAGVVSTSALLD